MDIGKLLTSKLRLVGKYTYTEYISKLNLSLRNCNYNNNTHSLNIFQVLQKL